MAFKAKLTSQAQLDIWDIIGWYETQQAGLGERFNNEVNKMIIQIAKKPTVYTYYKKDFRRAILKHFPYLIIFKIFENDVIIYTVIHGGRNPRLINKLIS